MNGPGSFLGSEWEQLVKVLGQDTDAAWHADSRLTSLFSFLFSSDLAFPRFPGALQRLQAGACALKHSRCWPFLQGWNMGTPVVCLSVGAVPLGAGARLSEFKSSHPHLGKLPNLSGPLFPHL